MAETSLGMDEKVEGALLGRMAGCTLGAAIEQWPIENMMNLAQANGDTFPPVDYWRRVPYPWVKRYNTNRLEEFTRGKMNGVPADDDIIYTLLGLLVAEEFGPDFSIEDYGKAWMKHLPSHGRRSGRESGSPSRRRRQPCGRGTAAGPPGPGRGRHRSGAGRRRPVPRDPGARRSRRPQ